MTDKQKAAIDKIPATGSEVLDAAIKVAMNALLFSGDVKEVHMAGKLVQWCVGDAKMGALIAAAYVRLNENIIGLAQQLEQMSESAVLSKNSTDEGRN